MDIFQFLVGIAWPAVAVLGIFLFKKQIQDLVNRVRKVAGSEFGPPQQSTDRPADALAAPRVPEDNPPIDFPGTEATRYWEGQIRALPQLAGVAAREGAYLRIAARAVLISIFEKVDGQIWASQVRLLEHLNQSPPMPLPAIQTLFYEPAVKQYPEIATHPFDAYIGFLQINGLIAINEQHAAITPQGREYLMWRIEQRRPARLAG